MAFRSPLPGLGQAPSAAPANDVDSASLTAALKKHFGFDSFRGRQEEAVRALLTGNDVFFLAATGLGKSLVYQLPCVIRPMAIVVSPLVSLMDDQVRSLTQRGIAAAKLDANTPAADREAITAAAHAGKLCALFVAPERATTPSFRALCRALHAARRVSLLAVDEAHCCSSHGREFRPAYRELGELRAAFPGVPCVALTATATAEVQRDVIRVLGLRLRQGVMKDTANRPNLFYEVIRADDDDSDAFDRLVSLVAAAVTPRTPPAPGPPPAAIVYCRSRVNVDATAADLAEALRGRLVTVGAYHANMPTAARDSVVASFRSGRLPVVVATVAFGLGVDYGPVRLVVHLNLPGSLDAYAQESGRAGRDGAPAKAVIFFSARDAEALLYLVGKDAGNDGTRVRDAGRDAGNDSGRGGNTADAARRRRRAESVISLCASDVCRRASVLSEFGEAPPLDRVAADCCDVCRDPGGARARGGASPQPAAKSFKYVNRAFKPPARLDKS